MPFCVDERVYDLVPRIPLLAYVLRLGFTAYGGLTRFIAECVEEDDVSVERTLSWLQTHDVDLMQHDAYFLFNQFLTLCRTVARMGGRVEYTGNVYHGSGKVDEHQRPFRLRKSSSFYSGSYRLYVPRDEAVLAYDWSKCADKEWDPEAEAIFPRPWPDEWIVYDVWMQRDVAVNSMVDFDQNEGRIYHRMGYKLGKETLHVVLPDVKARNVSIHFGYEHQTGVESLVRRLFRARKLIEDGYAFSEKDALQMHSYYKMLQKTDFERFGDEWAVVYKYESPFAPTVEGEDALTVQMCAVETEAITVADVEREYEWICAQYPNGLTDRELERRRRHKARRKEALCIIQYRGKDELPEHLAEFKDEPEEERTAKIDERRQRRRELVDEYLSNTNDGDLATWRAFMCEHFLLTGWM